MNGIRRWMYKVSIAIYMEQFKVWSIWKVIYWPHTRPRCSCSCRETGSADDHFLVVIPLLFITWDSFTCAEKEIVISSVTKAWASIIAGHYFFIDCPRLWHIIICTSISFNKTTTWTTNNGIIDLLSLLNEPCENCDLIPTNFHELWRSVPKIQLQPDVLIQIERRMNKKFSPPGCSRRCHDLNVFPRARRSCNSNLHLYENMIWSGGGANSTKSPPNLGWVNICNWIQEWCQVLPKSKISTVWPL